MIFLDRFYGRNRAFAEDVVRGLYVTENQGRDWVKIQKPLEVETSFNAVETHPFAKNYLILRCEIEHGDYETDRMCGSKTEQTSYISRNFGKSFERIFAPVEDFAVTPNVISHGTECWFAVSSHYSTLPKKLIYGVYRIYAIDGRGFKTADKRVLFYSPDLGETTILVEELRNLQELNLEIFSCAALVTARENIDDHLIKKLWISTGGAFKPAILPLEAECSSLGKALEDDLGRILLPFYTVEGGRQGKFAQLLIWDSFKFKLSQLDPIILRPEGILKTSSGEVFVKFHPKFFCEKFGNSKGTLLGKFFGVSPQDGARTCVSMAIHDKVAFNKTKFNKYLNLVSLDNGKSWSKLKLLDHSNIRRYLSKYNVEDLKNCSLQIFHYTYSAKNNSMRKVFMAKGAISHSKVGFDDNRCMSFISRDAGATWELAFTFPVYAVFADVGNIIVAIPQKQEEFHDFQITKVFYSSDQGKTWVEHQLEQHVLCDTIEVDTSGSKIAVALLKTQPTGRTDRDTSIVLEMDFSPLQSERK